MSFADTQETHEVSKNTGYDATAHTNTYLDSTLEAFLSRPIKILDYQWALNTRATFTVDPWYAYFQNAAVRKKLANFKLFKANMNVKILLNGTPFHYSRLMVSYLPLPTYNAHGLTYVSADPDIDILQQSQRMHVMVDPSQNYTAELKIPFFYPENYLLMDELLSYDLNLGTLIGLSTAKLYAASSAPTSAIDVTIMAWLTDVEMAVPTNYTEARVRTSNINGTQKKQATPPSEKKKDGLLSQVSSVVADVSRSLVDVPVIGGIASAVNTGAKIVGSIAAFFGWSKPHLLTDTTYMKPKFYSNMSYTMGSETVEKLTFDPQQCLTADPGVAGLDASDELLISTIAMRPSLIRTYEWSPGDAVDSVLALINVVPNTYRFLDLFIGKSLHMTSLAFAAYPFMYWTGSLKYRFEIVASKFHRGRIRVSYEPDGTAYSSTNYNTTYSTVIDLDGSRDITMCVPWTQEISYKEIRHDAIESVSTPGTPTLSYKNESCNGRLTISVLNKLNSPNLTDPITFNVYVSACEDTEFSVPFDKDVRGPGFSKLHYSLIESEETTGIGEGHSIMLFGASNTASEVAERGPVFFGEKVTSFRTLLKRYTLNASVTTESQTITKYNQTDFTFTNTPVPAGPFSEIVNLTKVDATTSYNYGENHLANYLANAFAGYRGSFRHKFVVGKRVPCEIYEITATRTSLAPATKRYNWPTWISIPNGKGGYEANADDQKYSTWDGTTVTPYNNNPSIEVELPYYNNRRFSPCNSRSWCLNECKLNTTETFYERFFVTVSVFFGLDSTDVNTGSICIKDYVATGEDFNFLWYLGPATFYLDYIVPPPA